MTPVFVLNVFVSAFLLFLIQPMFARFVLPLLGGAPNVWITCMVFFQAMLLAGYVYAHFSCRWLNFKRQVALHLVVVLVPLTVLPIAIGGPVIPASGNNPVVWLLYILLVTLGLPVLAVSSSAPLLQRWFSYVGHASSKDPYFLYAASNVGSVLALVTYPLVMERLLRLSTHASLWSGIYLLFIVLTFISAGCVWRNRRKYLAKGSTLTTAPDPSPLLSSAIGWDRRLWWLALAFVPSSLTLGVTSNITTDIAAVPMFWVLPLILYLVSYILVFARKRVYSPVLLARAFPLCIITVVALLLTGATQPVILVDSVHLLTLFVTALVCHGALADDRPPVENLTEFYLFLGIGGVLGGVFNALVAPYLFTRIVEYPLVLVLGCLLFARIEQRALSQNLDRLRAMTRFIETADVIYPLVLVAITVGFIFIANDLEDSNRAFRVLLIAAVPVLGLFFCSRKRIRFTIAVALTLIAANLNHFDQGAALLAERNFFGVLRVTRVNIEDTRYANGISLNVLYNGTTLHGSQLIDRDGAQPARSETPLVYYHRDGPIGDVMRGIQRAGEASDVGLVGLGTGAIAAYGHAGERYTFFEIDPAVVSIAGDARYFRYLADARKRGVRVKVVLGDARRNLEHFPDGSLDLLVLDAFSSNAIPVHLLSEQAVTMYLEKLKPRGVMAFHLSNRHVDLRDVVTKVASELHLVTLWRIDVNRSTQRSEQLSRRNSEWLVSARTRASLQRVVDARPDAGWRFLEADADAPVWTDDFSNILSVIRW